MLVSRNRSFPAVSRVLQGRAPWFRYCYVRQLHYQPDLAGTLRVAFTITARGHVADVGTTDDTVAAPALTACVIRQLRRSSFGNGTPLAVSLPLYFGDWYAL